jgi:hypothetical protein
VFFGVNAGDSNTTGSRNTMLGSRANLSASNFTNATAIGANAFVGQSDSLVLGSINGINGATADTFVGIGTPTPAAKLTVKAASTNSGDNTVHFEAPNIGPNASHVHWGTNGDWYIRSAASSGGVILQDSGGNVGIGTNGPADRLHVNGIIRVDSLGFAGSTSLCRNASNQISGCSSRLRYKDQVLNYAAGLDTINRLRPVTFRWKDSGQPDIGLVAEEIEKIEPLLVTYNTAGEVEGVKYDRVNVLLVNAIKQQQKQITLLQQRNASLQQQNTSLQEQHAAIAARVGALEQKLQAIAGKSSSRLQKSSIIQSRRR